MTLLVAISPAKKPRKFRKIATLPEEAVETAIELARSAIRGKGLVARVYLSSKGSKPIRVKEVKHNWRGKVVVK